MAVITYGRECKVIRSLKFYSRRYIYILLTTATCITLTELLKKPAAIITFPRNLLRTYINIRNIYILFSIMISYIIILLKDKCTWFQFLNNYYIFFILLLKYV